MNATDRPPDPYSGGTQRNGAPWAPFPFLQEVIRIEVADY
jgi:hypothetical protein